MNKILNFVAVVIVASALVSSLLGMCCIGIYMILLKISPENANWQSVATVLGISIPISILVMWAIHRAYNPQS